MQGFLGLKMTILANQLKQSGITGKRLMPKNERLNTRLLMRFAFCLEQCRFLLNWKLIGGK
jgi:hypothetical protein